MRHMSLEKKDNWKDFVSNQEERKTESYIAKHHSRDENESRKTVDEIECKRRQVVLCNYDRWYVTRKTTDRFRMGARQGQVPTGLNPQTLGPFNVFILLNGWICLRGVLD